MEEKYIAAVDLGSSNIRLMVAQIIEENIKVIYYKTRPSNGIKSSAIFNPKKAEEPIKELLEDAAEELKVNILQVVVSLPRCDIRQEIGKGDAVRSNPEDSISKEEIESLKCMAKNNCPIENTKIEKLYAAIAQSFSYDDNFQLIEDDIIGVVSEKIEGNFKLLIGKKTPVHNIEKIFTQLNVSPSRLYFTADTISNAILTEDEKDNGVALIDFGGGATSVSIYINKVLRYFDSIPFGGKSITNDIKTVCSISEELAENIKLAYGVCMPDRLYELNEKILEVSYPDINEYKQIPVKYLSEVITARVNEIIEAILYKIDQSGYSRRLRNGLVITGGGAKLNNLPILLKEMSGYNVRIGYPRHLVSEADGINVYDCTSTNCIGMVLEAKNDNINCLSDVVILDEPQKVEIKDTTEEMPENTDENPIDSETTSEVEQEVVQNETNEESTPESESNEKDSTEAESKEEDSTSTKEAQVDENDSDDEDEEEEEVEENPNKKKGGFFKKVRWDIGAFFDNMCKNFEDEKK